MPTSQKMKSKTTGDSIRNASRSHQDGKEVAHLIQQAKPNVSLGKHTRFPPETWKDIN